MSVPPLNEQLRQIRLDRGISVSEVAARVGTSRAAIYEIEAGRRACSVDLFQRFANAVGYTVALQAQN